MMNLETASKAPSISVVPTESEIGRSMRPFRIFASPADVISDPALTHSERRAILSSWASDAYAVESAPALRHPPFAIRSSTIDAVMDALALLDRDQTVDSHVVSCRMTGAAHAWDECR